MAPETMADLTLPDTQPYRVVGVGATYYEPVKTVGPDGKPTVILSYRVGGRGEKIMLTADQAQRLEELGSARPWDEEKSYDELSDDELHARAGVYGLTVRSSGADPDQPLRTDYLAALTAYDQGRSGVAAPAPAPARGTADRVTGDYASSDHTAEQLKAEVDARRAEGREIEVTGTGSGGNVLRADLEQALAADDANQ